MHLAKRMVKATARHVLPARLHGALRDWWRGVESSPPVGLVRFGDLRRLTPISRTWGFDRGQPVDRYYIERFLANYANDVRGRVLEIANNDYTLRFGGDRIERSDVLHVEAGNPAATIVADLTDAPQIRSGIFDCVICTQTLLLIYDLRAAIRTLHRILKPGGVVLVTVPGGASPIDRDDIDKWGDYWRFTRFSAARLFEEVFPPANVTVQAYGNVLAAISFLHGLAKQDLREEELDVHDSEFEVTISVRAIKPIDAT